LPSPLRQQLRALEAQLHGQWEAHEGAAPQELSGYRAAWMETFERRGQPISRSQLAAAWHQGQPALVSDFHSLASSARGLVDWLNSVPKSKRVHLTLELLPRELQLAADKLGEIESLRLIDGRSVGEALPELAQALRGRAASLGGAWVDAPPSDRDLSAAKDWRARRQDGRADFELMFFGDWHCARAHLPAALARLGAQPTVLHQSPAPLWKQCDALAGEVGLALGDDHYAWMTTPLLAQRSAHQQDEAAPAGFDPDAASELIEEIAQGLSTILSLPSAIETVEVISGSRLEAEQVQKWRLFRRSLPPSLQACLPTGAPPEACVIHPTRPILWASQAPSWNDLVECAAESVIRSGEWLDSPRDLTVRLAVRRCLALAWNPFLRVRSREAILQRFRSAKAGQSVQPESKRASAWLQQMLLSDQIAADWAAQAELSAKDLRTVLQNGRHAFIWQAALSTIRGTSRSAS